MFTPIFNTSEKYVDHQYVFFQGTKRPFFIHLRRQLMSAFRMNEPFTFHRFLHKKYHTRLSFPKNHSNTHYQFSAHHIFLSVSIQE